MKVRSRAVWLVLGVLTCGGPEPLSGVRDESRWSDIRFDDDPEDIGAFDRGGEEGVVPRDSSEEDEGAGGLIPCLLPEDCPTGVCVETSEGASFCAQACLDVPCPDGWSCTPVLVAGDPNWLCLPRATYLCRPCRVHDDCAPEGILLKNYCHRFEDTWFCGQDCTSGIGCPAGFECLEVEVPGVGRTMQCLPEHGECACIEEFVKAGYEALCEVRNAFGACRGTRRCDSKGLSPCDADAPSEEVCNGRDDDCDGVTDPQGVSGCLAYWMDADGDLYGVNEAGSRCLCAPVGLWKALQGGDCDDSDPDRHPGIPEKCGDGKDNDCDGEDDEAGALGCRTFFADRDEDGHGDKGDSRCLCGPSDPYTTLVADDCHDGLGAAYPGATETCDGSDEDCDGHTDEEGALGCRVLFWDGDEDGFGTAGDSRCLCLSLGHYTTSIAGDCNDAAMGVHPGATEACNGLDDDCDGVTDGDGALGCHDRYHDGDGDTYGRSNEKRCLCGPVGEYTATRGGDCDDGDPDVNPGAAEVCQGPDEDCDGHTDEEGAVGCQDRYRDEDGDGYGTDMDKRCLCAPQGAHIASWGGDCDDGDPAVRPGALEDCGTARDDNCNGVSNERDAVSCSWFRADRDGDGWGSEEMQCWCAPAPPFGATKGGDCDDLAATIHPGAPEVCNGRDDDCAAGTDDGEDRPGCQPFYLDADGDGWGLAASKCYCKATGLYRATRPGDCDDESAAVFPAAPEVCDGLDNDCDLHMDEGFDAFPDQWPGLFGPDPFRPWRYPSLSFATANEILSPSGDVDYFSIEATESKLNQCLPLQCKVTLSGIPAGQDYVLCACWSDIMECDLSGGQWTCSDNPGNTQEVVTVVLPESASCQVPGVDLQDHGYCDIRVARVSGPATCAPYQLNWIVWE